jgi:hypothetical protein
MSAPNRGVKRRRVQVSSLPDAVQKELRWAFRLTGLMDLYRGDAPTYLRVIGERLRDQTNTIRKLERQINTAKNALETE